MTHIITFHSARRGTGKSQLAASTACLLAQEGLRVGIMDLAFVSPGSHLLFGFSEADIPNSLTDYALGRCQFLDCVYPVTEHIIDSYDQPCFSGQVFLAPAAGGAGSILQILRHGLDESLLSDMCAQMIDGFNLDALVIDADSGLSDISLLAASMSDALALVLRLDKQDYQATGLLVEVLERLGAPAPVLVVNEVPRIFDGTVVRSELGKAFGVPVAAIIPHSEEITMLTGSRIFALEYPNHPITCDLRGLAKQLMELI